jgi:hypothetical protein
MENSIRFFSVQLIKFFRIPKNFNRSVYLWFSLQKKNIDKYEWSHLGCFRFLEKKRSFQPAVAETSKPIYGNKIRITSSKRLKKVHKIPKTGTNWTAAYEGLRSEIKVRHYSLKTLKTYTHWLKKI